MREKQMNNQPSIKLNHLSFPTHDVAADAKFWKDAFGSTIEFIDMESGNALLKHAGVDVVLQAMGEKVVWHKDAHFGFESETKLAVDALYEKLKKAGAILETEVHNRLGRGSRFFGRTPGGLQFEVNTRQDMESKWIAADK
jgi:uncharacterized glyoxalase superfamily protein PhnB